MSREEDYWLSCLWCFREFALGEIFIAFVDDKEEKDSHTVVICECLRCSEKHPSGDKKEKEGHWLVLERTLEDYIIRNE